MRSFTTIALVVAVCLATTTSCHAFSVVSSPTTTSAVRAARIGRLLAFRQEKNGQLDGSFDPFFNLNDSSSNNGKLDSKKPSIISKEAPNLSSVTALTLASVLVWMATSQAASAAGPDWGIFEGRTGSLLHPITMGGLFLYSAYTAFLGFQWRRQRTMGDDITALKKRIPANAPEKDAEGNELPPSPEIKAMQDEVDVLTAERKEIAAKGPRDQHFRQGALLAFIGTAFAIEGPLNTYARAGKLFPGPHLYAGAGLVCLWALAVATIPSMQKGNDTARTIHIGANLTGLALFAWQVTTGIPILLKVIEKTSWP